MGQTKDSGQSLIETAVMLPLFLLMILFSVNFGYFFLIATSIVTSSRNAVLFSVQGYSSPAQGELAGASSVTSAAVADLSGLAGSGTGVTVQVCSLAIGASGNLTMCNASGFSPDQDPEAPALYLQRVDVTYTIKPPVPLSFFGISLVPPLQFHRQAEMRAIR